MTKRLDAWLVESGLLESREKARLAIKKQLVRVNGRLVDKPALGIGPDDRVELLSPPLPFVSQGGLKLEKAIRTFGLDFSGCVVLDIGASTGGFTDCALRYGAALVYAIDSGSGQLHPSLEGHPQVRAHEKLDIRHLTLDHLDGQKMDWVLIDVSFISLTYVLPHLPALLKPGGQVLCLIKPQFELGRRLANKGGIVREERLRRSAVASVLEAARTLGFIEKGLTPTDVEDPNKKNLEYLCWLAFSDIAAVPQ